MSVFVGVLLAVGAPLAAMLLREAHSSGSFIAKRLVRRAARRLPQGKRQIREEEWLAELAEFDGMHLTRVAYAIGVSIAGFKLRDRTRARGLWRLIATRLVDKATGSTARPRGVTLEKHMYDLRKSEQVLQEQAIRRVRRAMDEARTRADDENLGRPGEK